MKNVIIALAILFFLPAYGNEPPYTYSFFTNSRMEGNYFFSTVNYTGNSWVKNIRRKLPVNNDYFFTPSNSLELEYVNGNNGQWNVVIARQPIRGQDNFLAPTRLSFRLFIASKGTVEANLPKIQIGNKDSVFSSPLSLQPFGNIREGNWLEISIPLAEFKGIDIGANIQHIVLLRFLQNNNDGSRHVLYIDDIEFLPAVSQNRINSTPSINSATGYERHIDITWEPISDQSVKYIKIYRRQGEEEFLPVGIQIPQINRYADYTGAPGKTFSYKISYLDHNFLETTTSAAVTATTKNMSDDELLTMVQEAAFRYYWEGAEKNSGLALENIPGRRNMIASGASGFGMMAILAGVNRGFISKEDALKRFKRIVDFLKKTETFHGAFPHFINGTNGKAEPFFGKRDNGGDLVETSFLLQGLLTARAYFDGNTPDEKYIVNAINDIWKNIEWNWYKKTADSKFLYWHWSPDQQWIINHQLIGWNVTMITYLLAIAAPVHSIPISMYYTGWANLDSTGKQYRMNWGRTDQGSNYENNNFYFGVPLPVGVNNGGPLFFIHYSYMGLDPRQVQDKYTNYFVNNRNIALINYRYCLENPGNYEGYGKGMWGLTASDGPYRYAADEPMPHQDKGKMAPTGAISSFPYLPEEAMNALKNYYRNYGSFLWGEYGFRDAFSLHDNWCSEIYMGLNQAPMVVMIENYRTGFIWKTFMKNKEIREMLYNLRQTE